MLEPDDLPPASPDELDELEASVDGWLRRWLAENPICVAVDRGDAGDRRWYVRLAGEEKDFTTVWLRLGQRALHFETYVVPAPEEDEARFYEFFLRANTKLHGLAYAIGLEDAVYLVGSLPVSAVTEAHLDRLIGSTYAYAEQHFRTALRIGFASHFATN